MSEQLIQTPGVFGENGNFLLERELGAGGMGGVYMGRDKMLDRPVAVKVMLKEYGDDPEFVENFKKEAQACARLIHPNIAQIFSYGICDGMPYMAMELASGGSLYSIMNANPGKTDVARVIKICQQVAQALQCASDQGFVHGDVKPENILLDSNGNAKLVDFGLAAMQKDTDEIWGTPYYISPEKVKKEPIDFRADMYSLGGTLYHALTGVAPFEGEDSIAVVRKRFDGAPKKPSEIRPELTPAIDDLVMKMLSLDKDDRYPSFEALLNAFKEVLTTGLTNAAGTTKTSSVTVRKTTVAGRRVMMRGRRTTSMKTRPATSVGAEASADAETGDGEGPVSEATGVEAGEVEKAAQDDEEEEGGGNLVLKVVGVVGGIVLAILLIAGGLVWYQISDRKAREAEQRQQIVNGIAKARTAIKETVASAQKFASEVEDFAKRATDECQKTTDSMMKLVPSGCGISLKPGPSKELLDAIASTNETPAVVEAPAPAPAPNGTNAVASVTNAPAAAAKAPVTTNAPAAKAAAPAAAAKKDAAPAKAPEAKAEAPKAEDPKSELSPEAAAIQQVIASMTELWERAYSSQASAVKIRHAVRKLEKRSLEADAIVGETKECVEKLAALSRAIVEMYEEIKGSKDVENVRKSLTLIRQKGENTVEQTTKKLRIAKLQAERKQQQEAQAAAEQAAKEKADAEKKAKIEAEVQAAKDKFELLAAGRTFQLLDWKSAIRQLETLKNDFATPEGQLAAELEIRKVNDMKKVHDILIKFMPGVKGAPGMVFKKGKLKGFKVDKASEKGLELFKGDKKNHRNLTWQKFVTKEFYPNIQEALGFYIFNGRKNAGLSKREIADALTGAALMFKLFYADEPTAAERSEMLAKESVKQFPEYATIAKSIFPDIDFGNVATSSEDE